MVRDLNWKLMKNSFGFIDRLKLAKFVLTSDTFTMNKMVKKVEKEWSDWVGSKYSLFVSSGSTANFLLIASLKEKYGLKDKDKVLVSSCTWMTNVSPIMQLGLTPVFCDINFDNFSFNEEDLKYIAKKHKDIKMVFVTHLLGYYSDIDLIKKHFPNAIIVEDACEAMGTKTDKGNYIGSDTLGATFSSYFGHTISSIEGGFVCTNDEELYDLMKMKRSHGLARESIFFDEYAAAYKDIDKQFLFITDGYNFRNHEICAVLASQQINRLNSFIKKRVENNKLFCELVSKHSDKFYPLTFKDNNASFCLPFICKSKEITDKLKDLFNEYGIEYRPILSGNLLKQPFLKDYKLTSNKKIDNVDILHANGLYIGNNQFISEKDIKKLEVVLGML